MDHTRLSAQERRLFNDVLNTCMRTIAAYELPITFLTLGTRFAQAVESGERSPEKIRAKVLNPELEDAI